MKIEVLVDIKTTLGEGPQWDVEQQRLYWVDSMDGRILRCTAEGSELRGWEVGQKIGSMALRKHGDHALVAMENGIHDLDLGNGDLQLIVDPEPGMTNNRLNDGKVDRHGRFLVGSMDMQEEKGSGKLFRLDPDLSLHVLEEDIICSNGPCWSPDGKTFYFADTWTGEIWAYDYDNASGKVSNRRTFARVDTSGGGAADGATVDAEGCVWQALVYDSKLIRYTPDGEVDRVIEMPVRKVTSVAFGGPDMDVLYVTSMGKPPLPRFPGDGQQRGSLFAITGLGIRGVPERRFAS
ncbi:MULTISPECIES: SMP-30/gluconolactonase/LRE family protein [unclassified Luteibacter]|uniref:SMP-30/gluconolactonase/LRE family protein n=1 Tax=unclassified Luteibacter TaxID=2620188 RepID=UPI0005BA0EC7|nr:MULTISPECIES: SMP-30/gluconolactonase/LRE family protein [unclassified Luteibacter]MDR6641638.1 sugar lactone lactonase YvrE [Luteibacter sp. 1214]